MTGYEKAVAIWQSKNITDDAELAEALSGIRVASAYHSGKIENENITYNDTREIFDHDGVVSYTGDLRTLFEIRNAREADELFLKAFGRHRMLDETLIKEFQYCLTQNTYDERRWRIGGRSEHKMPLKMLYFPLHREIDKAISRYTKCHVIPALKSGYMLR